MFIVLPQTKPSYKNLIYGVHAYYKHNRSCDNSIGHANAKSWKEIPLRNSVFEY